MPRKARPPRGQWEHTSAQAVAAAAAAAARKPVRARGGTSFVRLPNRVGTYSCGPVSLLQLMLWRAQVPVDEIIHSTNGCNIPSHVVDFVQYIRDITVETSAVHPDFEWCDPDGGDEMLRINELANCPNRDILTKEVWDKIMRWMCGYFDGRALKIGADAFGLDALVIVKLDSDGFLVPVDGMLTSIVDAQHLVFWDGYAHFEALVPEEEFYPVFPNVGKGFFFDVNNEELPPVPDIAEEWEQYILTRRANTPGVERGDIATVSYSADVAGVAGVVETPISWLSALLFVMVFARYPLFPSIIEALEITTAFARCTLLRGIMVILEFVVALSRWTGSVIGACMVEEEISEDVWCTGFTIRAPDEFHRCRLVRRRRYRNGTTGGLSREPFRRAFAAVRQFLAQINPPPEPPCRTTTQSFVLGAMYTASAMAAALAYGFAVASILFVAMFTWATVGSFLFPVDLTRDQVAGVDTPTVTRIKADLNCMSDRRRVPCRGKTHCRYGRRRGSKGYLEKQLKKTKRQGREQQRMYEEGLASIRGGVNPAQVAPTRKSARGHKPRDLDNCSVAAGRQRFTHHQWLKMEEERQREPGWDPIEHKKWMKNTKSRREEAERAFEREQGEQKEIEQDEADEREEQANASEIDEECQRCHETEERSDTDVIILCDGDGCSGAAHLGCCDPPLERVPDGKWFCDECAELHRSEEEGDDDTLPDAGSGAGGGGDDDLSDADFGTDEVENSDEETLPDAAPDGQAQRTEKPKRKRNATQSQRELCALRSSKYDSLIWRPGKEGVSKVLTTLNENYKKAMAMLKEIREARTTPDCRTLTYNQIQRALENENDFRAVVDKLEKFDYRLYGIKVQGGGNEGTHVKDTENNKTGRVRGLVDDESGYNVFDILWDNCGGQSRYSTREVLEGAERYGGEQGVTSPGKDDQRVRLFLQAVLCMVNVQVRRYVCDDDKKIKTTRQPQPLEGETLVKIMRIRQEAWKSISTTPLTHTMTECEKSNLARSGGGLLEDAGRGESLLDALGLLPYAHSNTTGLIKDEHTFHERQEKFVNHFVRGAQMSWKLGRPTSLESCITPLSAGEVTDGQKTRGEVDELSEMGMLKKVPYHELSQTLFTIDPKDRTRETRYGLGTRLLLARARVSTRHSSSSFKWWTHFPLYQGFDLTRPERLGDIAPTTENTGRVSQVRRHREFYNSAGQESPTWKQDSVVLRKIFDAYDPVATAKRDEAAVHENDLARIGRGNKVNKGRTMDEWNKELETLGKLVKECGIDPILEKIGDENRRKGVIAMCLEVLEDGGSASMGKRPDESHMYPETHRDEIEAVVDVLADAGVSAEDLERFSCALHIIDSLTSACLRPQDSLGCMARKAYIRNDRLVFVLPSVAKNSRSLLRSAAGMVVHHIKADEIAGPWAVMLVIGRRLMRRRLKENYERALQEVEELKEVKATAETSKDVKKATASLKKAEAEVRCYEPKKVDRRAKSDAAKRVPRSQERVLEAAELGDKASPFTKYGKNYSNDQLSDMYKRVGQYALGLPAFGPNILRTIHVTTVMRLCYHLGIPKEDQRVKDHFAMARHGEYEMRRSYDLVKSENAPYDPESFSARVAGIIPSHEFLSTYQLQTDFGVRQKQALNECLGDSLIDALKRQEGESGTETTMDGALERLTGFLKEMSGGVSAPNVPLEPATVNAINESLQAEYRLKAAKMRVESQELERKGGFSVSAGMVSSKCIPSVDESRESGRKHGLMEGTGASCKSVCTTNEPKRKKAKKGTYVQEGEGHVPLLVRMNGLFKSVVVKHVSPDAKYKRQSQECSLRGVTTFAGLCKLQVRTFLEAKVCEGDDGYGDVVAFYELFPEEKNESAVRDIVKRKNRAQENSMVWSDWYCRKCKKLECGCEK